MAQSAVIIRSRKKKALACLQSNRLQEAKAIYSEICRSTSRDAEAWFMLGAVNGQLGLFDEAVVCCRRAVEVNPGYADAYYNLGQAHMHLQHMEEAADAYRQVVRLRPDHADAHNNLGLALDSLGHYEEAVSCFKQALRLKPDHAEAYNNLGNALQSIGAGENCVDYFRQALRYRPNFAKAEINLAFALLGQGKPDEALDTFNKILNRDSGCRDAITGKAAVHEKRGQFAEAYALLQPLLEAGVKDPRFALVFSRVAGHVDRRAEAVAMLERILAPEEHKEADAEPLHYHLGKLYDELKDYDRAFQHFHLANVARPVIYDPEEWLRSMDAAKRLFTREFFVSAPRASNVSERPVFIVGMPRSGTSLVEQILASHPNVCGGGELRDMEKIVAALPRRLGSDRPYPDCLEMASQSGLEGLAGEYLAKLSQLSSDAARVTDKMPHNFQYLGLIALLFPKARVIHCKRHPLDTCLSIYSFNFNAAHSYATDLKHLGRHFLKYQELMAHWAEVLPLRVMEVQYEELVANQEEITRGLVSFCGLEWDEQCLRFYESKRLVNTLSYDQVRRPIYKQSLARWKRYEKHLGPLIEVLGISTTG